MFCPICMFASINLYPWLTFLFPFHLNPFVLLLLKLYLSMFFCIFLASIFSYCLYLFDLLVRWWRLDFVCFFHSWTPTVSLLLYSKYNHLIILRNLYKMVVKTNIQYYNYDIVFSPNFSKLGKSTWTFLLLIDFMWLFISSMIRNAEDCCIKQ